MDFNPNYTQETEETQDSNTNLSDIDFSLNHQWDTGFQGQIDITNTTDNTLDGWTLGFQFDGEITNIWNADIVGRNGDNYLISNKDWNTTVTPGQEIGVGFTSQSSPNEEPTNFELNGETLEAFSSEPTVVSTSEPISAPPINPNFGTGGQTYNLVIGTVTEGFDPSKDRIDLGNRTIHNHIPVQTENGFAMRFIWDPRDPDYLIQGVDIKDLRPENFAPIPDNHQIQDVSMVLAWENGTGPVRGDAVYILGHQEGREQEVSFDPQNQVLSMMYLNMRDNVTVEETEKGVKFTVLPTGQSTTLLGATFASLNGVTVEARPGQLEDDFLGRMGFSSKVSNFNLETYSREGIPIAGVNESNSEYLYRHTAYQDVATGTSSSHYQYNSGATVTDFTPPTLTQDPNDVHNHDEGQDGDHDHMSENIDMGLTADYSEDSLGIDSVVTGQGDDFDWSSEEDYGNGDNGDFYDYNLVIEQGSGSSYEDASWDEDFFAGETSHNHLDGSENDLM